MPSPLRPSRSLEQADKHIVGVPFKRCFGVGSIAVCFYELCCSLKRRACQIQTTNDTTILHAKMTHKRFIIHIVQACVTTRTVTRKLYEKK